MVGADVDVLNVMLPRKLLAALNKPPRVSVTAIFGESVYKTDPRGQRLVVDTVPLRERHKRNEFIPVRKQQQNAVAEVFKECSVLQKSHERRCRAPIAFLISESQCSRSLLSK